MASWKDSNFDQVFPIGLPLVIKGLSNLLQYHTLCSFMQNRGVQLFTGQKRNERDKNGNLSGWWDKVEKLKDLVGIQYTNYAKITSRKLHRPRSS